MKLLDRYLFKRFLTTYLFSVVVIVLIILVIDFVEKNDDFLEKSAPMRSILLDYYLNLAPYWANYVSPLMLFISTVFFTAQLASHTEIIAMLTSGISFKRIMVPYVLGASVVALFTFLLMGWVLPGMNKTRIAFENEYIKDKYYFNERDYHLAIEKNTYVYFSSYNNDSKTAYDFSIDKFEDNELIEKLSARRIIWVDSLEKWRIESFSVRKLGIMKDELFFSQVPKDTSLAIYPSDFESTHALYETYTIPELIDKINLIEKRGNEGIESFQLELYQRFANPFAAIILAIMALIVSSRKRRGGVGVQIAVGFVLAFIYILFFIMVKAIAESGNMSPLLAVWLPNLVFGSITTLMYFTVPR